MLGHDDRLIEDGNEFKMIENGRLRIDKKGDVNRVVIIKRR